MTAPSPSLVSIDDLGIRYAGRREPALDGVSLDVAAGSVVGIAGRTGAGKSSLALAAAGFIPRIVRAKVSGRVTVAGIDATTADASALLGKVGIVFATPANQLSASKLTVREELAFGLENLGVARSAMDARIDTILDRLGIAHLADREPFALSGGEQQRVAIASIVAMGTDALVLDEPTAQLDPFGSRMVTDILHELAAGGTAILVVEHDSSVLARADTVLVLDGGHAVGVGPPGHALGREVLGSIGLPSPTLVALAELGGLGADRAFDEPAIAAALREGAGRPDGGPPVVDSVRWQAIRDQPPTAVEIDGLTYRYGGSDVPALREVSLTFEPGETVAIVGQNGSGKTTLVKHLNGLLRPSSGRILVGGTDIRGEPVHRLAARIGFVFQNPDDQLFDRSVEREVSFGPRNLGLAPEVLVRLVDAALEAVGLSGDRSTNPYDLDISRRKLVALASVLSLDPAVLVLDEPTTGQDAAGARRVGAIVDAFRGAGRTVVAITHDMEFAADHFPRVIVMRGGQVLLDGPPEDVFAGQNAELLATAGIAPPPAARIGSLLGLTTPTAAGLLAALATGSR